jgi:hypothetical protein
MTDLNYGFEFNGKPVNADTYGSNYISELCRILDTYVPARVRNVLEWGSGLTTQVFVDYANDWQTELLVTIDENASYQSQIFAGRERPPFLVEKVLSQVGPGLNQQDPQLNYSSFPLIYRKKFDTIFIDGRRRMECAFIAAIMSHSETVIIIHDYRRSRYQPILALFESFEDGPQFRVMRPRPSVLAALAPGVESIQGFMNCLEINKLAVE